MQIARESGMLQPHHQSAFMQGNPPAETTRKAPKASASVIDSPSPKHMRKRKAESEAIHEHTDCMGADLEQSLLQQRNGSSRSSEQATDIAFHVSSCSPEQRDGWVGKDLKGLPMSCTGGMGAPQGQTGALTINSSRTTDAQRTSTSVSCQAGIGVVLPSSCFASTKVSAAAMSMRSISPFDMAMPLLGSGSQLSPRPPQIDDTYVNSLIDRARSIKHAVDREQKGKRWTVRALCKYLESALVYMEACENSHQLNTKSLRRTAWWV